MALQTREAEVIGKKGNSYTDTLLLPENKAGL
jgi:hypothetical protein